MSFGFAIILLILLVLLFIELLPEITDFIRDKKARKDPDYEIRKIIDEQFRTTNKTVPEIIEYAREYREKKLRKETRKEKLKRINGKKF